MSQKSEGLTRETLQSLLQDPSIQISAVISSKRRSIGLEIKEDSCLIVRIPANINAKRVSDFLKHQRLWILKKQDLLRSRPQRQKRKYEERETFLFLGKPYPLGFTEASESPLFFQNGFWALPTDPAKLRSQFVKWYHAESERLIGERVKRFAITYQFPIPKVVIRRLKSRWGSCGIHQVLHFNSYLIMAPLAIVDYVVVHELCHLRIRNHSKRFWEMVEKILPSYRYSRKWLRAYGHLLTI